ncbi:MAG TPA: c-type cytochrome [Bradyrhizobium sp.]|jgi:cytochrome c553|nr:c-type cytochrome [Bradyrhizobium sp.]
MSTDRLFTWKNPWFAASVGVVGAMAVLSLIMGFVVLPYATTSSQLTSLWDAICSAAGVPRATVTSETAKPDFTTSNVVMNSQMFAPDARSVGRGATLAMQCAICHGSNRQGQVDTPNLEGQPAAAVYKQLRDFKVAARTNAIMSPFAVKLSEQDMLDLAAYYAYLPRQLGIHSDATAAAPQIVARGAPMRNVPACSSCHGMIDAKLGTPWLEGQSAVYIKAQLQAFATGARRNDISEQMRNIARQMTTAEIDEAARYYASRP